MYTENSSSHFSQRIRTFSVPWPVLILKENNNFFIACKYQPKRPLRAFTALVKCNSLLLNTRQFRHKEITVFQCLSDERVECKWIESNERICRWKCALHCNAPFRRYLTVPYDFAAVIDRRNCLVASKLKSIVTRIQSTSSWYVLRDKTYNRGNQ